MSRVSAEKSDDILSDEQIIERVRAGETALFEILIRRHNRRLFRLVCAVMGGDNDTEDVMQEAYVRAYVHLDQFAGRASFATWLARIAIHEARARARRSRREVVLDPAAAAATEARPNASPELQALARELGAGVEAAITALPEHYRSVVMMRDLEGLDTRETAEVLELSEETVKVRLHRAHHMLRESLAASLGDPSVELFAFHAPRCDRVVAGVLRRLLDARGDQARRIDLNVPRPGRPGPSPPLP